MSAPLPRAAGGGSRREMGGHASPSSQRAASFPQGQGSPASPVSEAAALWHLPPRPTWGRPRAERDAPGRSLELVWGKVPIHLRMSSDKGHLLADPRPLVSHSRALGMEALSRPHLRGCSLQPFR